jgi:type IV secretory pathway TraG/TraD family ATPase VirD4
MLAPVPSASTALIALALAVLTLRVVSGAVTRHRASREVATEGAVVLGADGDGRRVLLSDHQLSAHGLIVGASGAGKSTTLLRILSDHVAGGRPVVAIDMKGSPTFARLLHDVAGEAGREFRVWTPGGPSHWNPLQHGRASELKDKLIATERFTEPHYQRAAERYMQTVLQVLQHAHPERAPTLDEVIALMDPRRLSGMLRAPPGPLAQHVQDYLAGLTHDQLSAIRGLQTRLAILTESDLGRYLHPPTAGGAAGVGTIDLRSALSGREVVLFSLNSSRYGQLAAQVGTLVVQDLVSAVGHRLEQSALSPAGAQAIIGIDEFSALGAEQVISLLARGREAGASVMLATQELADLDRAAPGLRDQVLGTTAIKIAHRQDVPSSAQTIAQMTGTRQAWEETHQIEGGLLGGYSTGRGTRRITEQFVVHPNEIKSLEAGQAVVITKLPVAHTRTVRVAPPTRRGGRAATPRGRDGPGRG